MYRSLVVSSPRYGFAPGNSKKDNPTEHRLLRGIDQTTKLNERYQQAQLYFKWFEPAWQELPEDERFVLDVCYRTPNQSMNEGLTIVMGQVLHCENHCLQSKEQSARSSHTLALWISPLEG